jgi:hypothetical protein
MPPPRTTAAFIGLAVIRFMLRRLTLYTLKQNFPERLLCFRSVG